MNQKLNNQKKKAGASINQEIQLHAYFKYYLKHIVLLQIF